MWVGPSGALTRLAIGLPTRRRGRCECFSLGPLPHCQSPQDDKARLVRELRAHEMKSPVARGARVSQFAAGLIAPMRRWLQQRPERGCVEFFYSRNVPGKRVARVRDFGRRRGKLWVAGVFRIADPNRFRIRVKGRLSRDADHVVCVSHAVEYSHDNALSFAPITVVPHSETPSTSPFRMQPDGLDSRGWGPPMRTFVLVSSGRLWARQKNLRILQKDARSVAPEAGSVNTR